MEALATAGALAVELGGRMEAEIASNGARGIETVRGLAAALKELGAKPASASRGDVDVRAAVSAWTAAALGKGASVAGDLPDTAVAAMTKEELTRVLDAVVALVRRLVGKADAEVNVGMASFTQAGPSRE